MAIEWLAPVCGLIGVGIGAGISYYTQTKTQKRAWQREYSVKIAETVYGNLYVNLKSIQTVLEHRDFRLQDFSAWTELKSNYRHLMVNETFRERLDDFSSKIEKYNRDIHTLSEQVIPSIIEQESKSKLHMVSQFNGHFTIRDKTGTITHCHVTPVNCLEDRLSPRAFVLRDHPNGEILSFDFEAGTCIVSFGPRHSIDESLYTQFINGCFGKLEKDDTYKFLVSERIDLVKESKAIFEELTKRIEAPWKI